MSGKEIIGGLAVAFGLVSGALYLWQIFKRAVRPHAFSWIIWGMLAVISFAAQWVEKAGPGSWAMGFSALLCFVIAAASIFYGEKNVTRGDWIAFITALLAIPVWRMTHDPLWAVVIASCIDAVAFYPTFRKSWHRPHEEGLAAFSIYALQMMLSIAAMEKYTLTVVLYPATILVLNLTLIPALLYRRTKVPA
ncbi:MAG: hypothetical protein KGL10_04565 [Alphaproteobacteria bacterium]|nr:hypothetical protein [Alphaproteobacteria bacterium]MDE2336562.1 hypothetical protein [Alphaproteobacteria bacterium]